MLLLLQPCSFVAVAAVQMFRQTLHDIRWGTASSVVDQIARGCGCCYCTYRSRRSWLAIWIHSKQDKHMLNKIGKHRGFRLYRTRRCYLLLSPVHTRKFVLFRCGCCYSCDTVDHTAAILLLVMVVLVVPTVNTINRGVRGV